MFGIVFVVALAFSGVVKCEDVPVWKPSYHVHGYLMLPYAEITEPFKGWYDGENQRSRIDYYGGTQKTYQLSKSGDFGTEFLVAPLTTEEVLNSITCFQINGSDANKIGPQILLPSLEGFTYTGTTEYDGKTLHLWQLRNVIGQKINLYTMYLYYADDDAEKKNPIPYYYSLEGRNTLFDSHSDHYQLFYLEYKQKEMTDEIFTVDEKIQPCRSFPGPGNRQKVLFNPMSEYMHPTVDHHVHTEFDLFKSKHAKVYGTEQEHNHRLEVFRQNLRFIHSKNRAGLSYKLEVNHLADLTEAERNVLLGKQKSNGITGGLEYNFKKSAALPESLDWRLSGAVTPVKDQAVCGSCWAFGTVGTIEGALFLKTKTLTPLSEQALVDCSWGYGNNGCDGGEDFRSYQWILKHGGIPTTESYGPYLGADGYCHSDNANLTAKMTDFVKVTSNDEEALKTALFEHGPVSVAIDAGSKDFHFYSNGVLEGIDCGNKEENLNHAVLAVGYGTLDGKKYWLIKNSWSTYWGNDGYALFGIEGNTCGVMTTPTFVNLE